MNSAQLRENCDYDSLWEICQRYGDALIDNSNALMMLDIRPDSDLGLPKGTIKRALSTLILIEGSKESISIIVGAYLYLDDFVADKVYNYFLPYLKTIKEAQDLPPEDLLYITDALHNDKEFAERFKSFNELKGQRKDNLLEEVNYLLHLAEREDLIINKEQGQ